MLSDEANMNDANAQVLYRSAQSIDERRDICEKGFIADSFFTYRVGDNGWLNYNAWKVCSLFPIRQGNKRDDVRVCAVTPFSSP
jgi:hypothetical protein